MFGDLKDLWPDEFREFIRIACLIILAIFILSLLWGTVRSLVSLPLTAPSPLPQTSPIAAINLEAKAALVYDIINGRVIFAKNKDDILPIASITKIMTAYTALTMVPKDTIITIRHDDILEVGETGLIVNEQWRLSDLVKLMLVSSSNDAASAIAAGVENVTQLNFVLAMNNLASQMGLSNTRFRNPTGLDEYSNVISGSFSTAGDIAKMFAYLFQHQPALFTGTNESFIETYSLAGSKHVAYNTNSFSNQIPSLVASKTGTTDLAGGSLAIIFKPVPNETVAVVVLGSTPAGRFADMLKLVRATISQLTGSKI